MAYKILLLKSAQKELNKLTQKDKRRIAEAIESLRDMPLMGKKLEGELRGLRSIRVWPFRILYEIKNKELIILVIKISHRKDVYK